MVGRFQAAQIFYSDHPSAGPGGHGGHGLGEVKSHVPVDLLSLDPQGPPIVF